MTDRIGIFGGTFSPPHAGHVRAAEIFREAVPMDRLYIIPTYLPPHKQVTDGASADDRLAMCRLAFSGIPDTEVSDLEIRRGGLSYTSDTLRFFAEIGKKVSFLVGTDMMLTLDRWHEPETIFSLADLYCFRRETDTATEERILEKNREYLAHFGREVKMIPGDPREISSSEIRRLCIAGDTRDLISPSVADYIRKRGLYR